MKKEKVCKWSINILLIWLTVFFSGFPLISREKQLPQPASMTEIEQKVGELMEEGDIPGLALVVVRGETPAIVKGFGYADRERQIPVTPLTLFELGSTSKAFTGLAVLKGEADGLLDLDAPVSKYLDWFYTVYEGERQETTVRQFLYQTSGLPTRTVSDIPQSDRDDALEQTVRAVVGVELDHRPGETFKYATVNYDILGAVIQEVTGKSYEDYMREHILAPLGLNHTRVGAADLGPGDLDRMAAGYKIGFFKARRFDAPVFRGNTPAGYIISNGEDMGRWLKLQLGAEQHPLAPLVAKSHLRDKSVSPNPANLLSYAAGWLVNLDGSGTILHGALNPNFTSYIVFKPEDKTGVMVLANSNSGYTAFIGRTVMNLLYGKDTPLTADLGDGLDKGSSLISFFFIFYLFCSVLFFVWVVVGIVRGSRRFEPITFQTIVKGVFPLVVTIPFLAGIYWLPRALAGFTWKSSMVWAPVSFRIAVILVLIACGANYINYLASILFPQKNKYIRSAPMLVVISIASGIANAVVIFLISIALFTTVKKEYLLFYFFMAAVVYIIGRKTLQTKLIKITHDIIYDMRVKLVEKIFHTSYQRFEKIESGRILATLNNDTGQIGNSAGVFVSIISSVVTMIGVFVYLGTIAFWATMTTLSMVLVITAIYSLVSRRANVYFNAARDTQNTYLSLLTGLQDGYKELSLHYNKKKTYKSDIEGICAEFRDKIVIAAVKFVNGFMVGETLLIAVLASVGFAVPVLFPEIKTLTLMGFIMVLLYLIGPVTTILRAIPGIMQIKISWNRVQEFMRDIPANMSPEDMELPPENVGPTAHIKAKNIFFEYESQDESEKFAVGPVDFEAGRGEIVFIVGGNGSGKTTLAKLLTGLYIPDKGTITVNGNIISNYQLGEYFSVVFGDYHLFEKLYDVDLSDKDKRKDAREHLKSLRLDKKVKMEADKFSTVNLSGGQRKRLALLRCYLEDRPIYLFDEVAADQDPEFRRFFYRDLLKKMKERGKTVIAITHDDHYFDVADRVVKMDMGKIELIDDGAAFSVTT